MSVLAVDFGTSFTAAALRRGGHELELLPLGGGDAMPSCVFWDEEVADQRTSGTPRGRLVVGKEARAFANDDLSAFLRNPKNQIDTPGKVLEDNRIVDVIAAIYQHALAEARRIEREAPRELCLTHPAAWSNGVQLEILREAGERALTSAQWGGVPLRFVEEPVAAAIFSLKLRPRAVGVGECLAIYDLGGGTFDAAVVRRTNTSFKVLASDGKKIGGELFDDIVLQKLDERLRGQIENWELLHDPPPEDMQWVGANLSLRERVSKAKEDLSDIRKASIDLPRLGQDHQISRPEFEDWIRQAIETTVRVLKQTIAQAGLEPGKLAAVVLTGGASRTPLVGQLIERELELLPLTEANRKGIVAKGAATKLHLIEDAAGGAEALEEDEDQTKENYDHKVKIQPRPEELARSDGFATTVVLQRVDGKRLIGTGTLELRGPGDDEVLWVQTARVDAKTLASDWERLPDADANEVGADVAYARSNPEMQVSFWGQSVIQRGPLLCRHIIAGERAFTIFSRPQVRALERLRLDRSVLQRPGFAMPFLFPLTTYGWRGRLELRVNEVRVVGSFKSRVQFYVGPVPQTETPDALLNLLIPTSGLTFVQRGPTDIFAPHPGVIAYARLAPAANRFIVACATVANGIGVRATSSALGNPPKTKLAKDAELYGQSESFKKCGLLL